MIKQQLDDKDNVTTQLQKELDENRSELEARNLELEQIKQQFEDKCNETVPLKTELENIRKDIESKVTELESRGKIIEELDAEAKASKSALEWFKSEVDKKQGEIQVKGEELEKRNLEFEDIKKQLADDQTKLTNETQVVEQLRADLKQMENTLLMKDEELNRLRNESDDKMKMISQLRSEKDQLDFSFKNMNDMMPLSVITLTNEDVITGWNKKTEEMLGLESDKAIGKNLFEIESIGKERLRKGLKQCKKTKKPESIKSISIKNKQGDVKLIDISQIPVLDSKDEVKGVITVINDVSKIAEVQAELNRRQEELDSLNNKFQDVYTQLKLVDRERNQGTLHTDSILKQKKEELESLNETIVSKSSEINNLNKELEKRKSALDLAQSELEKSQKEKEITEKIMEMPEKPLSGKLRLIEEIDKSLDMEDNNLKTKKIQEPNPEES